MGCIAELKKKKKPVINRMVQSDRVLPLVAARFIVIIKCSYRRIVSSIRVGDLLGTVDRTAIPCRTWKPVRRTYAAAWNRRRAATVAIITTLADRYVFFKVNVCIPFAVVVRLPFATLFGHMCLGLASKVQG